MEGLISLRNCWLFAPAEVQVRPGERPQRTRCAASKPWYLLVKTMDFGAFVNFKGTQDGLVHISELTNRRVNRTTDIVKVGDKVKVKVVGFDNRGKIKLSMKEIKQGGEKSFNRA